MPDFFSFINSVLWGSVMIYLLFGAGCWFTFRTGFGQFRGGPAWYMARGLGMRWMGVLFAVFLLIAYGIIFSGVQANAVARALSFSFDFPPLVTGIILAVFTLLAITRGLHGVARLMQGFVPLMAIIWVLTSLVICVMNIGQLPHVIWSIFESAFGLSLIHI